MSESPTVQWLNDLDTIEKRCRAASNAPWKVVVGDFKGDDWLVASCGPDSVDGLDRTVTTDHAHASDMRGGATEDAEFIAHARTDVLSLVKEVRQLRLALNAHDCDECNRIAIADGDILPPACEAHGGKP